MSCMVASNAWAEIIHHASDGILEERWLPGQMTDGAFVASLALLALEAERLRPSAILIDATQFQYRPRACAQLCANATANNSPIPVKTKRVITGSQRAAMDEMDSRACGSGRACPTSTLPADRANSRCGAQSR